LTLGVERVPFILIKDPSLKAVIVLLKRAFLIDYKLLAPERRFYGPQELYNVKKIKIL